MYTPKRKTCVKCRLTKALTAFYDHPHTRTRKSSWCKECFSQFRKPVSKEKKAEYWRKAAYGLDETSYRAMLSRQNNKCKICLLKLGQAQVDHNNKTGEVRGLLCVNCNALLGHAKDTTAILKNAIKYLNNVSA